MRLRPIAFIALAAAGCRSPQADAHIAQALNDAANELSALRQDMALFQAQIDSLRGVLAKQDTAVRMMANVTGVPIPR
jgi:hypothetical protein